MTFWLLAIPALALWAGSMIVGWRFMQETVRKGRDVAALQELGYRGRTDAAILDTMRLHPKSAVPGLEWISVAIDRRDFEEAVRRAETVSKMFPSNPEVYARWAFALNFLRRHDDAEALLKHALGKCGDTMLLAHEWMATARARADWEEALTRCATLREKFPHEPHGYGAAIGLLLMLGRLEEAELIAEEGQKRLTAGLGGNYLDVKARLAERRGDLETAADLYSEAATLEPQVAMWFVKASRALRAIEKREVARDLLAPARFRFPNDPDIAAECELTADPPEAQAENPAPAMAETAAPERASIKEAGAAGSAHGSPA